MSRVWGEWSEHDAGDGWKYYYNEQTKESMWEMPIVVREALGAMEDLLKTALAFSGDWGAFDAGFGTIYYFHLPSATSSWQRPKEWGLQPELSYAEYALLHEKTPDPEPTPSNSTKSKPKPNTSKPQTKKEDKKKDSNEPMQENTPVEEETEEQKQEHFRKIEAFRGMLREKEIMPTFKWEAVLPRIAIDERFRAIPSMDERRAIFEYFIKHRKAEIAAQMKSNMKKAKKAWALLVEKTLQDMPLAEMSKKKWTLEQFRAYMTKVNIVDDATTAVLPLAIQESVYEKKRDAWYPKAMCRRLEYKRLVDLWNDHKQKVMDAEEYTDPAITKLRTQVDIEHLSAIDEEEIFTACQEEYRYHNYYLHRKDCCIRKDEAAAIERRAQERIEEAQRKETLAKQEALYQEMTAKREAEEKLEKDQAKNACQSQNRSSRQRSRSPSYQR
ncbi:hypothetical protein THRCLA_23180, partial [Thraustotheca clavata]